jgi:hypothetical protein
MSQVEKYNKVIIAFQYIIIFLIKKCKDIVYTNKINFKAKIKKNHSQVCYLNPTLPFNLHFFASNVFFF